MSNNGTEEVRRNSDANLILPQIDNGGISPMTSRPPRNGTSISKTSFGSRKNTEDPQTRLGLQHFDNQQRLIDIKQMQLKMENRIRRLAFEQERANKLTDIATNKADKLLEARDRHQKQLEYKIRLKEQRARREEEQRLNNLAKRQEIINRQQQHKAAIFDRAQQNRAHVQTNERIGYQRRVYEVEQDVTEKRMKAEQIQVKQRQFLKYKDASQNQHQQKLNAQYQAKEEARQRALQDIEDKIKQLEGVESYMVQELGKTQKNQQRALTNLHNVVQLCNQQIIPETRGEYQSPDTPAEKGENMMITQLGVDEV